jgi:hypothetical protein
MTTSALPDPVAAVVPPKAPYRGARVLYTMPDGQLRAADVVLPIAFQPTTNTPTDPLGCKLKVLLDEDLDFGVGLHRLQGVGAVQDATTQIAIVSRTGFVSRAEYDGNMNAKPNTWRWGVTT